MAHGGQGSRNRAQGTRIAQVNVQVAEGLNPRQLACHRWRWSANGLSQVARMNKTTRSRIPGTSPRHQITRCIRSRRGRDRRLAARIQVFMETAQVRQIHLLCHGGGRGVDGRQCCFPGVSVITAGIQGLQPQGLSRINRRWPWRDGQHLGLRSRVLDLRFVSRQPSRRSSRSSNQVSRIITSRIRPLCSAKCSNRMETAPRVLVLVPRSLHTFFGDQVRKPGTHGVFLLRRGSRCSGDRRWSWHGLEKQGQQCPGTKLQVTSGGTRKQEIAASAFHDVHASKFTLRHPSFTT